MNKIISNYRISQLSIVILFVLFLGACNEEGEEREANVAVPVSVQEVQFKSIEKYINTTGTVNPIKQVELRTQIGGAYSLLINPKTRQPFVLGDRVAEGQAIVVLSDEEYVNGIKLESQKLNLEITKETLKKQKSLFEKGGVTLNDLKTAEVNLVNAEYAYKDAMLRMNKLKIIAPFSGVIVDLPNFTKDTRVDANAVVVKLMDYSKLYMEINLPEKDLLEVEIKHKVRIMNYTIPDDTLWGEITQLSPAIQAETRTFKGLLSISNPDLLLRPGMFVKADIIVAQKDSALVIPKDIILQRGNGMVVFIVDKTTVRERVLSTGLENPEEIEVVAGIEFKDRVVIKGFETLRDHSNIKIMK